MERTMQEKLEKLIADVINPLTGKTIGDEGRILELKYADNELTIRYDREGIQPEVKRGIENNMIEAVSDLVPADNISILSFSKNSKDVYGTAKEEAGKPAEEAQKQASLNVGHGPGPGAQKKKVNGVKHVIAVSSAKGGVGKSTLSVNLAYALRNTGAKVSLLDADIYGPSLPLLLNSRGVKPSANSDKKIIPIDVDGVSFMSFGLFIDEAEPVIWRGPMLGGVLNQFLFDVDWGDRDYLIIDLPPGTGDMQLSMVQATDIDGVVVVSTPQEVALLDSKKGLEMFRKVKTPILGMIENMSAFICDSCDKEHNIFGKGGVEKAAKTLDVPFFGSVPLMTKVRECSDNGTPFMSLQEHEGTPVWEAYMGLAKEVSKSFGGGGKGPGFMKKLFGGK